MRRWVRPGLRTRGLAGREPVHRLRANGSRTGRLQHWGGDSRRPVRSAGTPPPGAGRPPPGGGGHVLRKSKIWGQFWKTMFGQIQVCTGNLDLQKNDDVVNKRSSQFDVKQTFQLMDSAHFERSMLRKPILNNENFLNKMNLILNSLILNFSKS